MTLREWIESVPDSVWIMEGEVHHTRETICAVLEDLDGVDLDKDGTWCAGRYTNGNMWCSPINYGPPDYGPPEFVTKPREV